MTAPHQNEQLVRFLASTQERLLRYIFVLLPDWDGAQEVLQNTHVVIWRKAAEFHSGTEEEFVRWARQIAYYEVKKYVAARQKTPLALDAELMELIRDELNDYDEALETQRERLSACIDKLPPRDQELLRLRYWHTASIGDLSAQLGRKADALYKSLQRIRRSLLDCIERESRRVGHA